MSTCDLVYQTGKAAGPEEIRAVMSAPGFIEGLKRVPRTYGMESLNLVTAAEYERRRRRYLDTVLGEY